MKKLIVAAGMLMGVALAWGGDQSQKTWEWTQTSPGNASYDEGANWKGGVAPNNYAPSVINNTDAFVFTNALSALQIVNLGNGDCWWYGCQFGSIVMDRFHQLCNPQATKVFINDASKMEGFIRMPGGANGNSAVESGPILQISNGRTNCIAQVMVQNGTRIRRYGDNEGGVAEIGKAFGSGLFTIGGEESDLYRILGSPAYLFDAFQTGVQGHLRVGERAQTMIKGHDASAAIATGAYLHLDAAAAGTVGGDFTWHDANGGPVVAKPVGTPVWGSSTNGLRTITLGSGSAYELSEEITDVKEVFLVFRDTDPAPYRQPPPLMGDVAGTGSFSRHSSNEFESLFVSGTEATRFMDAGEVWYDGTRVLPDYCGSFGGQFHVVSVMLFGGTAKIGCFGEEVVGAASGSRGNVAFAEVLVYKRTLTDVERRATNKYLRQKWQTAELAYDWDLGSYMIFGGNGSDSIVFEEGTTAIRELGFMASQQTFVKRGAGRLEVGRLANENLSIDVREGALAVVRPEGAVVCEAAADPIVWFDPSDNSTLTDDDADATRAKQMIDRRKTNNKMGQLPTAQNAQNWGVDGISPKRVNDTPTGLQALDFGAAATSAETFQGRSSRMSISGFPVMREGFVVWKKNANACGAPFATGGWDFFGVEDYRIVNPDFCPAPVCGGYWTVNGEVVCGHSVSLPTDEYMVVALRPSAGVWCTCLGSQREWADVNGACAYGELILYDRILTPAERRNTEAYLMKKWLNKDHPMAKAATMNVPTYTIGAAAENTIETDADMTIGSLTAANASTFTKKGKGRLVTNLPVNTKAISVDGGTLEATDSSENLFRDAYIHFDASDDASFVFESGSDTKVVRWNDSRVAAGLSAMNARLDETATELPRRVEVEINGVMRKVVDFNEFCLADKNGANVSTNTGTRLRFWNADVETDDYKYGLHEFYIVRRETSATGIRPQILAARPYVIDRNNNACFFHITFPPIKEPDKGYSYQFTIDDADYDYDYELEDGTSFHVFCLTCTGFQFQQQYLGGDQTTNWENTYGGQQIAEVVTFETARSAEDRQAIIDYLSQKWMGGPEGAAKAYASVVAAGGTKVKLDLAGWNSVTTAKLTGGGSVDFGVPLMGLEEIEGAIASDGTSQPTTVAGAVSLGAIGVIKVACPVSRPKSGFYPILSATSITNPEVLANWTLQLSQPIEKPTAIEVQGGQIGVVVKPLGLAITIK